MQVKLYTVPTANGQRASIALEECGIEYDVQLIDLMAGEHRSDEMLAINPIGRMPVIALGDYGSVQHIYGSLAIATWAANTTGRLLPTDDDVNDYYQWMGIVMTDLAPAFASHFCLDVLADSPQTWGVDFYLGVLERILRVIDDRLGGVRYMLGERFSLVDVMLFPAATSSFQRVHEQLPAFANLQRWVDNVAERATVQTGMAVSSL